MLSLVATPIGNLRDITFRAIEILKSSHYILCEDTRHSKTLLQHYSIHTPLKSYHKFNEKERQEEVINDLKENFHVALISDAGTPALSDPGADLVSLCKKEGIKVQSIPGACAAIVSLTASGLDTSSFQFSGFLPRKKGELKTALLEIIKYPGTTVCYESPLRIQGVLELLATLAPQRKLVIARELTKKYEEIIEGTAETLFTSLSHPLKGEIVLLIEGNKNPFPSSWNDLTIGEHLEFLMKQFSISKQEALKIAAEQRGVSKRELYKQTMLK